MYRFYFLKGSIIPLANLPKIDSTVLNSDQISIIPTLTHTQLPFSFVDKANEAVGTGEGYIAAGSGVGE